jgi:hypothetical protein
MDFNIRAISLAESIAADARCAVGDLLGKEITFRGGESIVLTLPAEATHFGDLIEPERLLTALTGWTRVFRYPEDDGDSIHVLAVADSLDEGILFYRIDLRQVPPPSRRARRPTAQIVGGAVMTYEECAGWLIDLSSKLAARPDEVQLQRILQRPRQLKPKPIRVAWVGPEILHGVAMPARLQAIGRVYGVEIVHVAPRRYPQVAAQLRESLPLDAAIICDHFAPYIDVSVVPEKVRQELVHVCNSKTRPGLEEQVRTWADLALQEVEKDRHQQAVDEGQTLLKIMLRGMLSHSKIGQFSHCQKATVLTGVRARRLNVPLAEEILDRNSEVFRDTKSEHLFLWKEHGDGRQYFLNPQKVESIQGIVK